MYICVLSVRNLYHFSFHTEINNAFPVVLLLPPISEASCLKLPFCSSWVRFYRSDETKFYHHRLNLLLQETVKANFFLDIHHEIDGEQQPVADEKEEIVTRRNRHQK